MKATEKSGFQRPRGGSAKRTQKVGAKHPINAVGVVALARRVFRGKAAPQIKAAENTRVKTRSR